MTLSDYDFQLPRELIAGRPAPRRQDARMMILDRGRGTMEHARFGDFPGLVGPDALVVLNDTKVIPARIFSDDGRTELLLLEPVGENVWKCLVRPGRRNALTVAGGAAEVVETLPDGERLVRFAEKLDLEKSGHVPLPPYLRRASDAEDAERYQTVYARNAGAVAAPTAGLHFTPEIIAALRCAFVTLHVGPGTFKPVKTESLEDHKMHSERYSVTEEAAAAINAAQRLVAVGTTTVRVLESRPFRAGEGRTDIFIYPPFEFRMADALLTNFHLPKSTLLLLVSAFAGREFVLEAYARAVEAGYRFYSYGDCMFIR